MLCKNVPGWCKDFSENKNKRDIMRKTALAGDGAEMFRFGTGGTRAAGKFHQRPTGIGPRPGG